MRINHHDNNGMNYQHTNGWALLYRQWRILGLITEGDNIVIWNLSKESLNNI